MCQSYRKPTVGRFFATQLLYGAHMDTTVEDKLFQDTQRRVAKFRENQPRDVEKLVDGKKG